MPPLYRQQPGARELYFATFNRGVGYTIMVMKEGSDGWSEPLVAPFSGQYSEVDPFITLDGKQLFFISKRPLKEDGARFSGYQIWALERSNGSWGNARHLGPAVNGGSRQLYPTVSEDGSLYFNSNRGSSRNTRQTTRSEDRG